MAKYTLKDIENKYHSFGMKDFEHFSKAALTEIKQTEFPDKSHIYYEDHTKKRIVTIDNETTKDIDDAIYLEKLGKNYVLTVYIADVSYYVKKDSKLDEEAQKRGTSIYLPNKTLPMLPNKLTNDLCSLKENHKRPTIAISMTFNKSGNLINKRIFKALICSKKKMTYQKVTAVLEKSDTEAFMEYHDFVEDLYLMKDLALILRKKRKKNNFIELYIPEFDFFIPNPLEFDSISITPHQETIAHTIIEEFMLCANMTIAQTFNKIGVPFIYRTHSYPYLERLPFTLHLQFKNLSLNRATIIKKINWKLKRATNIKKILLSHNILGSFCGAKYENQPYFHFALNSDCYCHFTSPIRRYPDLYIHRIISDILDGELTKQEIIEKYQDINAVIARCNEAETFAKTISREMENAYIYYYMQDFIGKTFDAYIYKISRSHIYILLEGSYFTGKIKCSTLSNNEQIIVLNNKLYTTDHVYKNYQKIKVTLVDITKDLYFVIKEN